LREFFGAWMRYRAAEDRRIFEFVELLDDRLLDLAAVVSDRDVPQAGRTVDQFAARVVVQIAAVAAHDAQRLQGLLERRVRFGAPEMRLKGVHCEVLHVQRKVGMQSAGRVACKGLRQAVSCMAQS